MKEITWKADDLTKLVHKATAERLERCAYYLQNKIKEAISEPSNHGLTPSAPGQPPHKDLGRLRASISHEVDKDAMVARVGTNVEYGKFLELGTRKMAARPFLRETFAKETSAMGRILKGQASGN